MALVAIPAIPPLVIPPATGNPCVFVSPEVTGSGPWTWTGLTGDEAGLRGYKIVGRITKAAAALHTFGIQFNNDSTTVYSDRTGGGYTSGRIVEPALLGLGGEVVTVTILIPVAKSGVIRQCTTAYSVYESGSPSNTPGESGSAWDGVGAPEITRIDVINATGTVDDGAWALYKLMDVS